MPYHCFHGSLPNHNDAAFWFGPYNTDPSALAYFAHIPQFDQFFVRAATRMLLAKATFDTFDDLDRYDPAVAIVSNYVRQSALRYNDRGSSCIC